MAETSEWPVSDEGYFTIRIPIGLEGPEYGGFDSYIGAWSASGIDLSYDLGAYSNELTPAALGGTEALATCDGSHLGIGRTVRGRQGGREFVAAHWPQVGPPNPLWESRLSVLVSFSDPSFLDESLAILASVELKESPTDWPGRMTGIVVCRDSAGASTGECDTPSDLPGG